MAGGEAQAGFYYQNVVAALHVLKLIEIGSPYRSITLENPNRAKYIDDIIVERIDRTVFIQVKWSENEDSPFTLHNLTSQSDDAGEIPLLRKLARGYEQAASGPGTKEVILFSTRKAGSARQPSKGFDKSLAEFLTEFHTPFVNDEGVLEIRQGVRYPEYQPTLDRLIVASGLNEVEEFSNFLKCLRFELGQPDRETMVGRVRAELAFLGIEESEFGNLLDHIIRWSIERRPIDSQEVLKALGLVDHYVDRLSQDFPVDEELWVPTPGLFQRLDRSIEALDSGFILLEGEPGIGKSSALAMYRKQRPQVAFGYFCYVPNERALGNERLEREGFIRSLCIGLRNAFPEVDLPRPYADYSLGTLNEWLRALGRVGRKVIFIVDGLDHIEATRRRSVLEKPLTSVLEGELPANVLVILSSQYIEALPEVARQHIQGESARHIRAPRFRAYQVADFFARRGIHLASETLALATEVSGGVPIYLEYLAGQLAEKNSYEQEEFLKNTPSLRDEKIDLYHSHLWSSFSRDELLVYILALLAVRQDFTTVQDLLELLAPLGVQASRLAVERALGSVRHVLRRSDAQGFAIRHNSFREFVIERTAALIHDLNETLCTWYAAHPDRDEAWRHQFRHLFELGKYRELINACTEEWFGRSWRNHRPLSEINRNIDLAWRAATSEQDLAQFVRIALLKERAALIGRNLDLADAELGCLFLDIGLPKEALRTVWDGERPQCGPASFAHYCLHHFERLHRMPPDHVVRAGLREAPLGASKSELATYYRACASIREPLGLLEEILNLGWQQKRERHEHVIKAVEDSAAHEINLSIALAVEEQWAEHKSLDFLREISTTEVHVEEAVREYAKASTALLLARAGEFADAKKRLDEVRFGQIPVLERNRLLLNMASLGLWDRSWAGEQLPPDLPRNVLGRGEQGLAPELFTLVDELRVFFLCDDTGFAWLEASVTGLPEPVKTLTGAFGRLARLWCKHVTAQDKKPGGGLSALKEVTEALDLDRGAFDGIQYYAESACLWYMEEAARLFGTVWGIAAEILTQSDLVEFADWWAISRGGDRARKYAEATRNLAVCLHRHLGSEAATTERRLLELAESCARQDEETSVIVAQIVGCARAWGLCSFTQDAERLWSDLFDLGCGIYWRKDYQFNEILTPLELVRQQHTSGIPERIAGQLSLAHTLEGTARSNTIAVAIEGLIAFAGRVSPGLALRMLQHEEPSIHRSRAIRSLVAELLKDRTNDTRWVWALACTMERWDNHTDYDENTRPAMRAIFESSLGAQDRKLAEAIYVRARHIFLVEKGDQAELGEWARLWVQAGAAPEWVMADYNQVGGKPAMPEQTNQKQYAWESSSVVLPAEGAKLDPRELERLLDELERDAFLRDRQRELDQAQDKWRTLCVDAVGRDLSSEQRQAFDENFQAFRGQLGQIPYTSRLDARQKMGTLLEEFVSRVNGSLGGVLPFKRFVKGFDVEAWLDSFVHAGGTTYFAQQQVGPRLPGWIQNADITDLEQWAEFCHKRCERECRAEGLLAVAKRVKKVDPSRAFALLTDAWKGLGEFFYEHGALAQEICSEAVGLDARRGCHLLLESFRWEHLRFPQSIVYHLDQLLRFVDAFPATNRDALYEVWAAYNRQLTAGLAPKPVDVQWMTEKVEGTFPDHCLRYLLWLLDYPVVDVRRLTMDVLYELVIEKVLKFECLPQHWDALSSNQKEHVAVLAFSLALSPRSACLFSWDQLVSHAYRENHYNLRRTVAEAVMAAASNGASLDRDFVRAAQALARRPAAIVPVRPAIALAESREDFRCLQYQRWVLQKLEEGFPSGDVPSRVRSRLAILYPDLQSAWQREMATHREYNINTNFDVIEISGEFDGAVREATNQVLHELIQGHVADDEEMDHLCDLLRLYDPTDASVELASRPASVNWIDTALSEASFLGFSDWDSLKQELIARGEEWITLFEHCEQRGGEGMGFREGPAARVHVALFGVKGGSGKQGMGLRSPVCIRHRNRYRFELRQSIPPSGVTYSGQRFPIIQVSKNALRGRNHLDTAAIRPDIAPELRLKPASHGWFDYDLDGEPATKCIEWQEPFDQGRRRHEPRSSGFLLEMRRELLFEWARRRGYAVWVDLSVERTVDKYKPESEMNWVKRHEAFPI
jgi:hypothetical protein